MREVKQFEIPWAEVKKETKLRLTFVQHLARANHVFSVSKLIWLTLDNSIQATDNFILQH